MKLVRVGPGSLKCICHHCKPRSIETYASWCFRSRWFHWDPTRPSFYRISSPRLRASSAIWVNWKEETIQVFNSGFQVMSQSRDFECLFSIEFGRSMVQSLCSCILKATIEIADRFLMILLRWSCRKVKYFFVLTQNYSWSDSWSWSGENVETSYHNYAPLHHHQFFA